MRTTQDLSALEEIDGTDAKKWVEAHNLATKQALDETSTFKQLYAECEALRKHYSLVDKLMLSETGHYQRIEKNALQQISKESYLSDHPKWTTLFQATADTMSEEWKLEDTVDRQFKNKVFSLLLFSHKGSDRHIVREFDLKSKKLKKRGFSLPLGRHDITWLSPNALLVALDLGPESCTTSHYPRTIYHLKRNVPIEKSKILFQVDASHMMATSNCYRDKRRQYLFFLDHIDMNHTQYYLVSKKNIRQHYLLPVPLDAELEDVFENHALFRLCSRWEIDENTQFNQNTLIGIDLEKFKQNPTQDPKKLVIKPWFEAGPFQKIDSLFCHGGSGYIFLVDHLCMQLLEFIVTKRSVRTRPIMQTTQYSYLTPLFIDCDEEFIFQAETLLEPKATYAYSPEKQALTLLKKGDPYFQPSRYFVNTLAITGKDGEKVPYHIVAKKGLTQNGCNPTVLKGYGGFDDYNNPSYLKHKAHALLDQGFVLAFTHIRGGGEFGARWHHAGKQAFKQNSFDDFIAIAEDLIAQNITSPEFLGIEGASNGGLLVGACMTQRPDLFKAVFCDVPLLDMKRYDEFFVGASWKSEYGDPKDPEMLKILSAYSPIHHLSANTDYPRAFFQTSTTDDRVHPYHARAMTQTLENAGKPVLFFEKEDGGHTGSSFEEVMRVYTYWHLQLLQPAMAQRKRVREEVEMQNSPSFFQSRESDRSSSTFDVPPLPKHDDCPNNFNATKRPSTL